MVKLAFNSFDSWALWRIPTENLNEKTPKEREQAFGNSYQPNMFLTDQLSDNLEAKLKNTQYVLVGMNPGNGAKNQSQDELFLNFHGAKKSMDYRLAAATYNTDLWGAFMSDLSHTIESDSKKVKLSKEDVNNFEAHLDELGIPNDATLVALGGTVFKALQDFSNHPVAHMYHYSNSNNGHWTAEVARKQVLDITQNN